VLKSTLEGPENKKFELKILTIIFQFDKLLP